MSGFVVKKDYLLLMLCCLSCFAVPGTIAAASSAPNIVYILADDLGYGDVHCLNPERGKIATPQHRPAGGRRG